jgi:hypothetical protein
MSRRITNSLLALVCGLALVSAVVISMVQAGDGDPPSSETTCDPLKDATPGLYGLCLAFNEAQDCEPDLSVPQADRFAHCKPASLKVLEVYDRKKDASDPEMPNSGPCCFDEAAVNAIWDQPGSVCQFREGIGDLSSSVSVAGGDTYAQITDWESGGGLCLYVVNNTVLAYQEASDENVAECEQLMPCAGS